MSILAGRCAQSESPHAILGGMEISDGSLTFTKAEAATRQVEAAIEALVRGHFDIAITLAGAAEGMIKGAPPKNLFAYHR